MKFYEYEAKQVFASYGIPIPKGGVASSPREAREIASSIGKPVVLKVQVLVGGRGKAGGIKFASSPEEAEKLASELLGSVFKGFKVNKILVEEKLSIKSEFYIGITIDRAARKFVAIASSKGGVDIEEVAKMYPHLIVKEYIDPLIGFHTFMARNMLKKLNLEGSLINSMAKYLKKLHDILVDYDAELIEINPLVLTGDNQLVAVDARLNIDQDALFRHKDLMDRISLRDLTPIEIEARKAGLSYVELDGDIGIIGNGAGLVMATLDLVKMHGGSPANFLDVGGGASEAAIAKALQILLEHPRVKVILVNILGGITRCDVVAKGIVSAFKSASIRKPIVIRLVGTNEDEGRRILKQEGIPALTSIEEATSLAVKISKEA
ncbi:MAG: ADP-forming succinate--CoA ligase subunit beta [archaeon GB-1867-035]|nr:ADP-forming succinate--CoA ligase subunit beta [Candidatus Culexmicrobium profundum]